MSGIVIEEVSAPEYIRYDPSELGSGTINMSIVPSSVDLSGYFTCGDGGGYDFRLSLKQGSSEERLDEFDSYNDGGYIDKANECRDNNEPEGDDVNITLGIPDDIAAQYDGGSWSGISPGEAKLVVKQGYFHWTGDVIHNTWEIPVEVLDTGLPVESNVTVDNLSVTTPDEWDGRSLETEITITNPTNHGVEVTGEYKYQGGSVERSYQVTGVISIPGENKTVVKDEIVVDPDVYGPLEVCYLGQCDTIEKNVGTDEIASHNASLKDCSAKIVENKGLPGAIQTIEVGAIMENLNAGEVEAQLSWTVGGNEILTETISLPGSSESEYLGDIYVDLPIGDSDVEVNVDSITTL